MIFTLAVISTFPKSSYAYREEKAWRLAEQCGMTPDQFKAQHSKPTPLEQIVINANIHWQRIQLGELFASWGAPEELAAGTIFPELEPVQSPATPSKLFPCPPIAQNQSF